MNSNTKVTTNLRIPKEDWLMVRAEAAALGMSANEYIRQLIIDSQRQTFFAFKMKTSKRKSKKGRLFQPLWDLLEKPYQRKPMGASEEDKIIYGIDE